MTIREAKEEIRNTLQAYLAKDARGEYRIPLEKQRPLLLMGPPGIGKTAIMEQVAREAGVNLVSYTITHHTRQSAIGLPFISKRNYGDREYSITEYTMSEIIAAIYDRIEESGVKEGILFLDEINCVSETLVPTMLQFLQYKTFGSHRVPDGFIIVTAGNPPAYNASVRDFDVVTLDRLRRIDITADYDAWKTYALSERMHGAVVAYLEIHKDHFYRMRTEAEGRFFVTARGWEDLSRLMTANESLGIATGEKQCVQFLQDEEIAQSFALYLQLWQKYRDVYDIRAILAEGSVSDETRQTLQRAPFDEKLSVLMLLHAALADPFGAFVSDLEVQTRMRDVLRDCMEREAEGANMADALAAAGRALRDAYAHRKKARLIDGREGAVQEALIEALSETENAVLLDAPAGKGEDVRAFVRARFSAREEERMRAADMTDRQLTNAFSFLDAVFGEGQEMVLFLTQLMKNNDAVSFLNEYGNEAYRKYSRRLLLDEQRQALIREALSLQ